MSERTAYLPALRWKALTPAFDAVVRATARETAMKERLLEQADIGPGDTVLDLGAGTGTLAIRIKQRCPTARVVGLDADRDILAIARSKAAAAHCDVELVEALSTEMPFPARSFDFVVSTLFFHHLTTDVKRATLREVHRVLKPGGGVHVGDWGRPGDPVMAALFLTVRAFDGFGVTADNARGRLPALFAETGLEEVRERRRLRTALGTVALYSARKPA
jgi:ubiquinone/menaquinone biosynthesis C-methylase UbiE